MQPVHGQEQILDSCEFPSETLLHILHTFSKVFEGWWSKVARILINCVACVLNHVFRILSLGYDQLAWILQKSSSIPS